MADTFTAFVIEDADGKPKGGFKPLSLSDLPDHDVLVEVAYSTLNYKDGLAVSGKGRIARKLPMVAGIDLAGTVVESRSADWKAGDKVIVNGWGLSETQWGGYSRFQRVKPEWLTRLPDVFSAEEAMGIGTAGYTAALCVDALEDWGAIQPGGKEVLVTGAAGGVGSVAVALLAKAGYPVTASTGRPETHEYLSGLGATGFIDRAALQEKGPPLQKERWAGGVDSVGGITLVNALSQTVWGGAIAACGLAGSADLPGTVLPHILRSVTLIGVDSVAAPAARRERAWARLARDLDKDHLKTMYTVEPMSKLPELAGQILAGRVRGRVVIDVTA
ncbi:oxidoreductase [Azospirillum brasilense]|uniref:Oxidoreductase n=1 Tax=Azospirillum brasilense TaxID=192 RepID=A0A0P0EIJ0_AZOBR|nr:MULTISPECIES: MDR family oxidoreductase [Azospirillum]ALJ35614.1 NADPH:quinone dehydrogenase [Azospirillum brasilense]MDW7554868.1 MDR family oxidoreductase [Azospirillum brasilense]MDW7594645.1 MDR family oxidoreductase [Azospirillum brasilense]MDW7629499.1 MDR family oxidoreductase [Azospirillum brasilense]MDX5954359.1 MDR family oxidoreductase [Azospirillum brasilense]